jgi:hypothetical protein
MMGPEDHLRLLCLHFLRHGAARALGLCDVGAAIERLPPSFDFDYFLSGHPRRTEAVLATIGLAQRLLGARIERTPFARAGEELPPWLVTAVLRQWGSGQRYGDPVRLLDALRSPASALSVLRRRWPNPVEATLRQDARFNNAPRLPIQIAHYLRRPLLGLRSRWRTTAWSGNASLSVAMVQGAAGRGARAGYGAG